MPGRLRKAAPQQVAPTRLRPRVALTHSVPEPAPRVAPDAEPSLPLALDSVFITGPGPHAIGLQTEGSWFDSRQGHMLTRFPVGDVQEAAEQ
ncbi:hypothetical protein MDA_GLEAN10011359 [Myotis davidii]|uniref:Uncharacterized protein n=1 Tax=Myotis davidii TaxID=225400 RepID=L5LY21_MYODS|nr:hypothetical protein MDA_GLEAN10011359 [Myotis davidii]